MDILGVTNCFEILYLMRYNVRFELTEEFLCVEMLGVYSSKTYIYITVECFAFNFHLLIVT